jgi:glycosyltransferase involved in cell wall biosynthesis
VTINGSSRSTEFEHSPNLHSSSSQLGRPSFVSVAVKVLLHPFFYLPEAWNGIDEHLLLLARHVDPREVEFVVAVGESDGPQTAELARRANLPVVALPATRRSPVAQLRQLRRFYRHVRPDIVHMHTPAAGGQALPALAARLSGAAAMLTVHQYQPWSQPARTRTANRAAQRLLFSHVIAVSDDIRTSLAERAGLSARSISVVLNGIDEVAPAAHRRLPQRRTACQNRLLEGYPGRRASTCSSRRWLLPGTQAPTSARSSSVLDPSGQRSNPRPIAGLGSAVEFLGFVPNANQLMREVDFVAHTPRYEGFGLVVLEAMASSRPVVVAPAPGGIAQMVVHGETGLVAAANTPSAVAESLLKMISDKAGRARMGENAYRRWRDRFTAARMAAQTAAVYRDTLRLPPASLSRSVGRQPS